MKWFDYLATGVGGKKTKKDILFHVGGQLGVQKLLLLNLLLLGVLDHFVHQGREIPHVFDHDGDRDVVEGRHGGEW